MSTLSESALPKLRSANFTNVDYKSGAHFKGNIEDHKKSGKGIFSWPNGARYEGEYADNQRHGKGIQLWQDGSHYDGDFVMDMRHGHGKLTWSNGEIYEGTFFKDRRHGDGMYTWPDGSTYTGTFYMDRKEGYGIFKFANGNTFEGLYKEDERAGPGVMTYTGKRSDVGLWHGEKLIKFFTKTEGSFTMKDYKEFDFNADEHIQYISLDSHQKADAVKSPEIFDYLPESKVTDRVTDLYNETLDPGSLAVNKEMFDKEFFKDVKQEKKDKDEKVKAWNRTPSIIEIQRHVYKHRQFEKKLSFKIQDILKGDRSKFKQKGHLESASVELIQAATKGDLKKVEDLLSTGQVHPDVADLEGHTALIGATVNWHMDVINCLLNHGADINKLNDEGCSALSAGTIFYYPVDGFKYNIAERYLEKPPEVIDNKKGLTNKPKGILHKRQSVAAMNKTGPSKPKQSENKTGISSMSVDSGFPQTESNGSLIPPQAKHQVRIIDPADGEAPAAEVKGDDSDSVLAGEKDDEKIDEIDFESDATLQDYEIEVSEALVERCATQLSTNERIVGGRRSHNSMELGTVRHLAVVKSEKERMKHTIDLLLRRGADPNASGVPMPVLFFAIKSADVEVVKVLLMKGASAAITLPKEKGGLAPLHIAVAIPGEEGVQITELLLNALADPDVRASEDDSFLNRNLEEEWSKDSIHPESQLLLGGRTPLQIACARDDNYKNACRVVHLLLEHKANTNLLCNGFSALALAIASGNDLAIDELLLYGCDPSLPLTHGVGSALCAATSTEYEHRRSQNARLQLIDKLVKAGANILAPIPIGPKRILGTAVDYAYYMFNQDRRIAHMPYHALTHAERETYNARRKLLAHIGDILRTKAVDRERRRLEEDLSLGKHSRSPSPNFAYVGAGAELPPDARKPRSARGGGGGGESESKVTFDQGVKGSTAGKGYPERDPGTLPSSPKSSRSRSRSPRRTLRNQNKNIRKPLFKYCYECGRSVGVRLSACTRCKEVYYCGKACKLRAWNARHKEECIRVGANRSSANASRASGRQKSSSRIDFWVSETSFNGRGGRSRSPSPTGRKGGAASPTPATNINKGKKTTVDGLTRDKQALRVNNKYFKPDKRRRMMRNRQKLEKIHEGVDDEADISDFDDDSYNAEVTQKGYSKSAHGPRGAREEENERTQSEQTHRNHRWSPPPGVYIHNYSHV